MRILIYFSKCGGFLLTVPRHHKHGGQTIRRDGRVDLEDLWWLSFNSPSVPRLRSRGGQTILDGMVGSTLTTCGGFLLTVPQSLGIAAEEDRQSWAGWPGQP